MSQSNQSPAPVDVLAVLRRHAALAQEVACVEQIAEAGEVLAAVAELIREADLAQVMLPESSATRHKLRAALARVGGAQ